MRRFGQLIRVKPEKFEEYKAATFSVPLMLYFTG